MKQQLIKPTDQENFWDFLNSASVNIHLVGPDGTILFANKNELDSMGYGEDDYVGHNITEFHIDKDIINDILERLTNGETLLSYVARLRKCDGSVMYVSINSNVYKKDDAFINTRCFTTEISESTWEVLKDSYTGY